MSPALSMFSVSGSRKGGVSRTDGVSIIMAVWNQLGYTRLAVESILKNTDSLHFELIVVDNGSRGDVKEDFASLKKRGVINY